ncbi:MAG: hypothetical protein RIR79_1869 [Pseudomonadota bacterium]
MNITAYETDIVAWAHEQAALIRAGRFEHLDLANLAEEIEDVGKSEKRELATRMAVLLAHWLKWKYQPSKREQGFSWERTIRDQRKAIARRLKATPSVVPLLTDPEWMDDVLGDAVDLASKETGIPSSKFPEEWPWSVANVLQDGWFPPMN